LEKIFIGLMNDDALSQSLWQGSYQAKTALEGFPETLGRFLLDWGCSESVPIRRRPFWKGCKRLWKDSYRTEDACDDRRKLPL